jgi:zinc protease
MSAPIPGTPRAYHFPAFERRDLTSGATAIIAPLSKLPLVTVMAVFPTAGASSEPADSAGIAQLTAAMLLEGTESRDGAAVAEAFESLGSSLAIGADWDCATATFTVEPSRLFSAIELLREVLRRPAFRSADLARLKGEHQSERLQIIADPRALGDSAFAWSCYKDTGSRFRRPIDGTLRTIESLGRDDLASFWKTRGTAAGLSVVVAGDISVDDAMRASNLLLDSWESSLSPASVPRANAHLPSAPTVTLVEKPDSAQSELRIGHIGVPRAHPRYFELTVLNAVLGGLFSSRINLNLRERHGYTYGAFSAFDWRVDAGPWTVSTAVKSEVSGAAIGEILSEINRIRAEPITNDELELATKYLVGVFPLRFETTAAVAAALTSLSVFGLPSDYFDTYRTRIAAVTPTDVLEAAREHLHPASLHIVAVGEPAVLRGELEGRGPVSVMSTDEVEAAK